MTKHTWPFLQQLNEQAYHLCQDSVEKSKSLGVNVVTIGGATVLDFAVARAGTISGGIRLSEICLSDMADVSIVHSSDSELPLPRVQVTTDFPIQACIGSQYAGWAVTRDDYFAMCSGPARSLRGKEEVLTEYDLTCSADQAVGVLEANELPTKDVVNDFSESCHVNPSQVTLCVARTASFPGAIQVVARSIETTLHKLHELRFDLGTVQNGIGSAPLPPIAGDDLTALGWTNDAILYGGRVNLWVAAKDEEILKAGERLPSSSSTDFGQPFLNIFNRYDRDFYKIDKLLFSPAHVVINNLLSGRTFSFGQLRPDILRDSFGLE